jgi:site-specific DNA recombinase
MTVGYTRLSLDKYGDLLGVTRQREDIVALAKSLGWPDVTEFYEDNDISANASRKRPRPQFERLLGDIRAGQVSHVLCYDQDRLVRDMRQLEDVVDAVETGRAMLTSVNGDIDLLTDNGRMVARIKAAVARNELEKLSRRIKRQKLQRAQRGVKNQGPLRTFGYQRDYTVVPKEALVLVELFERRAGGESITSLVRWLNAAQIRTSQGNAGNWAYSTVSDMLARREYVGDVTINGEVVGKAKFKSIIDRETFEKASGQRPSEPAAWRSLPESGLLMGLLVCGVCRAKMKRGRGLTSNRLYACTRHQATLGGRTYLSVSADSLVLEAVRLKTRRLRDEGSTKPWVSVQASAIEHEIVQANRMHSRGELTQSAMDAVVQHLLSRLAEERSQPTEPFTDDAQPDVWSKWDLDARRGWLAQTVSHIVVGVPTRPAHGPYVESGRVTVHFKDGEAQNLARQEIVLADVARRAGCSRDNASRALNGTGQMTPETRERVRAAAEELGYARITRRTDGQS